MSIRTEFRDAALELHKRGLHPFPCDHPDQPACIGLHGPETPCDLVRGKHPSVKYKTWAVAATPQMIEMAFDRRAGLCNIGVACGPAKLVVLDEDELGEMDRWCKDMGITLPETYIVTTARGRHFYFNWDHSKQHIGNSEKPFKGFKINVRGEHGLVIGEGSQHETGVIYAGNGKSIADLPQVVADLLLAGVAPPPSSTQAFFSQPAASDPNATMIADGMRHHHLVAYAGRLLGKGLDYFEAEAAFQKRWLLCEQPDALIPEATFHTPTCRFPVTWDEAQAKLTSVFNLYAAGNGQAAASPPKPAGPGLKRWKATDLEPVAQQRFLAKNRIPRGAVTILCGDEGIGKSLLWVQIVVNITTGKPFAGFGIPARAPGRVILVLTEDDWQTAVLPRLTVAGADLDMIEVICEEKDGSGSPIFPDNMELITKADPKPDLVVVDAWLDTVPSGLKVRDTQQSREALHPWRDAATRTDAAITLLTHANRISTDNMRDKYGATAALRQKARMTLYALADPNNGDLIIGPDKANSAVGGIKASRFRIFGVQYFEPTPDSDGTVPSLQYDGDTGKTIKEHLAEIFDAEKKSRSKPTAAEEWLVEFLKNGPRKTADILAEGAKADGIGYSPNQLKYAKDKVCGPAFKGSGADAGWYWELLPGQMPQQRFWRK